MSGLNFSGPQAFNALSDLSRGEGWLLSVKIAAHRVELTGDFSNVDTGLDGERILTFSGVTELRFSYNQSVFDIAEDDISTIDVMKLRNGGPSEGVSSHISFEFSYGTLQFDFEEIEIYDRTDANIPR